MMKSIGRPRCATLSVLRSAAVVMLLALIPVSPGQGETPSVDELVRLALAPKPSGDYMMRANYALLLSVRYGNAGLLTTTARGALTEWHRPQQSLHREITIQEMHLP